jgi:hypothetical protein
MGSCVLRETIRKGRPRFAPRVSLSIYLSIYRARKRVLSEEAITFKRQRPN